MPKLFTNVLKLLKLFTLNAKIFFFAYLTTIYPLFGNFLINSIYSKQDQKAFLGTF
jgi:hypothetical protein